MNGEIGLDDRFVAADGHHLMTGNQAVGRALINQWERDRAAGLKTAGFVSGYRGSPLGNVDTTLARIERFLKPRDILVKLGVNEDMAATAVWGSQEIDQFGAPLFDGVFGLWYAKGPGVDRSGDSLRHANLAGVAQHGGVIALAGDDHTCKSSTTPHHSELALIDASLPIFVPADIQDLLDHSAFAWALSRHAGVWAAIKVTADVMDGTAIVDVAADRVAPIFTDPPEGVHLHIPVGQSVSAQGNAQETALFERRLPAVSRFLGANAVDRAIVRPEGTRWSCAGFVECYGFGRAGGRRFLS